MTSTQHILRIGDWRLLGHEYFFQATQKSPDRLKEHTSQPQNIQKESPSKAKSVEGQVMVRLKLRREGDVLRGNLWGTRFKFNPQTQRVISVQTTAAEAREWVRL